MSAADSSRQSSRPRPEIEPLGSWLANFLNIDCVKLTARRTAAGMANRLRLEP